MNIISVDVRSLQREIGVDLASLCIKDICVPRNVAKIKDAKNPPPPEIIAFHVSPGVLQILPDLKILNQSMTFAKISESYGRQALAEKETLALEDVRMKVFQPALAKLRKTEQQLLQGSITLGDVDQVFGSCKVENLRSEFEVISQSRDKAWIDKRLDEIHQYRQLNTYRKGAEVMESVRKTFNLKGDFTILGILASAVSLLQ